MGEVTNEKGNESFNIRGCNGSYRFFSVRGEARSEHGEKGCMQRLCDYYS